MKVVAFVMQKGGTGKTTTTLNLAAALAADYDQRVLLVDMDPQGSLTTAAGFDPDQVHPTIYQALVDECSLEEALVRTGFGVDLLPANMDLAAGEVRFAGSNDRLALLLGDLAQRPIEYHSSRDGSGFTSNGGNPSTGKILKPRPRYDFAFIDCPASLGLLTYQALIAADEVLIPLQAEYLSMASLKLLMRTLAYIKERFNPDLAVGGLLLTMYDRRTRHARHIENTLRQELAERLKVFDTIISRTVSFAESNIAGLPLVEYDPSNQGARAYRSLAKEVMQQ